MAAFIDFLRSFASDAQKKFASLGSAAPEDQLKPLVGTLLTETGTLLSFNTEYRTENTLADLKVRPDIAIYVGGLIVGYIELKKPGTGADAPKFKDKRNKEQWERLKNLPNLIYTDGRDWALYRDGGRVGTMTRFAADPTEAGSAAVADADAHALETLLRDFLAWKPHVPHKPTALAAFIAPMTRFLRFEVEQALKRKGSNVHLLATEWRSFFFPDADDAQFADAYAQTVTYAMLLARLQGAAILAPAVAAKTLDKGNRLLARALELLGQPGAHDELRVGFELLQRSLEALDPVEFLRAKPDLWLYFYEDFLAAYDPKLRKDFGVYYTPREVVELQVRLASELLETHFGKKLGFADDGVVFLDPAVGTGTYLVATVKHALESVRERSGPGAVPARAAQMARNMYGFEMLVGPYAVAHLRLTQALESMGAKLDDRLRVYLADTLESPNATPPGGLTLTYKALTEEHEAAREIKKGGDILVCLGNPPYDRQRIDGGDTVTHRKGGWVRFGDQIKGGSKQEEQGQRPIFEDFLEPARKLGMGVYLQVMYNDYLYFWRWALWRMFEQQSSGGIITFITASSYIAGPGFVGVRKMMRETFDELWIIDLGGDNLGTRRTPNVFTITTPVAIAIGVRGSAPSPLAPATVRYCKIDGITREEKLNKINAIDGLGALPWRECPSSWHAPFLPEGKGDFFDWPALKDLFPWRYNGTQWFRSWPVGPTPEILRKRLEALIEADPSKKPVLFKESAHRQVNRSYNSGMPGGGEKSINELTVEDLAKINISRIGWRSLDRQWAIVDSRFGDRLREPLWHVASDKQVFLTSLMGVPLADGPAMLSTPYLADCHIMRGSYGGRDIIPLFRDNAASMSNITSGLLSQLSTTYGREVAPEEFAGYVYALLTGQSYTKRFWNELETPDPRVPLTKDKDIFFAAAALGRRMIWLHTYAQRFQGDGQGTQVPKGTATCIAGVPDASDKYPEDYEYLPISREVRIGEGRFGPVTPEVWEFEVSGLKVVQSWLGYRMKVRSGKKSSPLDDIRPERWTPTMTDEFLELLWVLEATLAMEPALAAILEQAVAGPCFKAQELPMPTDTEREPPKPAAQAGDQYSFL